MSNDGPIYSHAESVFIEAPPSKVWDLVTAMERYGEWSSENTGGYWRKKPDGSVGTGQIGDEFVGINRRDGQEWKGLVEIVERDEERAFTFITGGSALNFVQWGYGSSPPVPAPGSPSIGSYATCRPPWWRTATMRSNAAGPTPSRAWGRPWPL
jgi:uncharacterized protein YndB with AHSA1/START domain